MSTKKKSDAMQFLESLVGELTFGGLIEAMRQAEEMSQVDFAKKSEFLSSTCATSRRVASLLVLSVLRSSPRYWAIRKRALWLGASDIVIRVD